MNHTEKYSDSNLESLKEVCTYSYAEMRKAFQESQEVEELMLSDIFQIALIEINRELNKRKIRHKTKGDKIKNVK